GVYMYSGRGPHPVSDRANRIEPGRLRQIADTDLPPPAAPQFGMNLAQIADFGRQWSFVDVFKHSRPWIERGDGPFAYDPHGWPRLKHGQAFETLMVRELDGHYPGGRYVATWQGAGEVELRKFDVSRVISAKPGRIEVDVRPGDGGL